MKEGTIGDMSILGITESFQVKRQVLLSAAEAAEVILRVDNIIKAAPRYCNTLKNILGKINMETTAIFLLIVVDGKWSHFV